MKNLDFIEADENGIIEIPDELMPLFNKIGFQLRFHTISGKNEILTIVHIMQLAQDFFMQHPDLILNEGISKRNDSGAG